MFTCTEMIMSSNPFTSIVLEYMSTSGHPVSFRGALPSIGAFILRILIFGGLILIMPTTHMYTTIMFIGITIEATEEVLDVLHYISR